MGPTYLRPHYPTPATAHRRFFSASISLGHLFPEVRPFLVSTLGNVRLTELPGLWRRFHGQVMAAVLLGGNGRLDLVGCPLQYGFFTWIKSFGNVKPTVWSDQKLSRKRQRTLTIGGSISIRHWSVGVKHRIFLPQKCDSQDCEEYLVSFPCLF